MEGGVLTCREFDSATNTCTVQEWAPPPSFLPPLSVADAFLLGSAMVGCWALAYAFNRVEKSVRG